MPSTRESCLNSLLKTGLLSSLSLSDPLVLLEDSENKQKSENENKNQTKKDISLITLENNVTH